MIERLSLVLLLLNSFFGLVSPCSNGTVANGQLIGFTSTIKEGEVVTLMCDNGYATYNTQISCTAEDAWSPQPACHKVNVRFEETSMIRYLYPIPFDSSNGEISFTFSVPPEQSSGVLVRLSSKKQSDGTRDTLTIELVGGFLATTMQFNSVGEKLIGFCHDDAQLNDNRVHSVRLVRQPQALSLEIDNRNIRCSYPESSRGNFTFTELRSITVGHLQPAWGADYGMTGCMSDLDVDGIAPLILADLKENAGIDGPVSVQNVQFVENCGSEYVLPTDPPVIPPVTPPVIIPEVVTGKVEGGGGKGNGGEEGEKSDRSTIIIIVVTIAILILLVLIIGIVCKRYYSNKGTYRVNNAPARDLPDQGEQEYFI